MISQISVISRVFSAIEATKAQMLRFSSINRQHEVQPK